MAIRLPKSLIDLLRHFQENNPSGWGLDLQIPPTPL